MAIRSDSGTRTLRRASTAALLLMVLAACGGGAPPGGTSGAGTAAPGSATQAPGGAATQAPAGGQGIADFCLNTEEEVSGALGVEVAEAVGNENAGFGGGCLYNAADGTLVYAIGVVPVTSAVDPISAALGTEGAVAISGIGDSAVLVSAQGPLVFRRGDWIVSSGGTPQLEIAADAAAYRAALETLARAAAGRI